MLTADRDRLAVCRLQASRDGLSGRHARQAARRQVGGRRVGRRRYFSHYFQTIFSRVCVTKYVYQCILYVYKAISGVQIIILYHTTPYVQLTVFELLSW